MVFSSYTFQFLSKISGQIDLIFMTYTVAVFFLTAYLKLTRFKAGKFIKFVNY